MSKCWKDFLLSSSIPLEDSVRQILRKMKFCNLYEYNYLRKNENGIDTNFSVDFSTSNYVRLNDKKENAFYVNYLIECKYCSPDTKWIFMPDKGLHNDMISLFMDDFDINLEVNFDYWETFPEYPLVSKGTELLSKNCNPDAINKAVHQLSYAYINRFVDHIDANNIISCTHGKLFFIVPIIVTTAELWKINLNTTIETIEQSKALSDIAISKDLLLYQYNPDNMMQKYFQEKLRSLDKDLLDDLENHLKAIHSDSLDEYLQCSTLLRPSNIIIINYKSFEKEFKKLNNFLSNKKLVKKR